jgi:parvulin-like peptidyl-prolyl isomerase
MAMMAKMRSLAPWFIISVGGLFVLFMVLSDSKITDIISQRSNNIGSVNGDDISYQEFSNLLDQYKQYQVNQTGQEIPESQMENFRNSVWQNLVSQKLVQQKIKDLGLNVTDEEVKEALLGPNPPASVTQYFIDSTGSFNREAYEAAIFNTQNREAIIQVEEQVRAELLQQKLRNYINASVVVSEADVLQRFIEQNIKMDAKYVLIDANNIADSNVTVSDDDLEDYYNENKANYKIDSQRKIKYVLFKNDATAGDSSAIRNNLYEIVNKLQNDTASFKTYVEIYSEQPYSKDSLGLTQISKGAQEAIINAQKGQIVGPLLTDEGYAVYRLVDIFAGKEEVVRASHILVDADPNNPDNDSLAQSVYTMVTSGGQDFAEVAKVMSKDPGSGQLGGDLGWFGKGQMVPEFEKAAFAGKINVIQKPVKSQFGWHIIKTTGKSKNTYVVEKIVNKIAPSMTTLDLIYENAGDFAYLAEDDGFEKVAGELGYPVIETQTFKKDAPAIPGLGSNRSINVFAFDNSIGTVSPVFKVPSGYTVCMVSAIEEEGYKPLEEVKESITNIVRREKKKEKTLEIAENVYKNVSGGVNLNDALNVYDKAKIDSATGFSTSGVIGKLGREFAFAYKASRMKVNDISEPFIGVKGSYILKLTKKSNFDSTAYSIQKNSLRDNLLNQKKNTLFNNWIAKVTEQADIEDNRHLFYR